MVKKISLLGMEIDNYTTQEALERVEAFMEADRFDTIGTITMKVLDAGESNPTVRSCIENLSLAILGDVEILHAVGLDNADRRSEIKNRLFFSEFMKRVLRNHKTVYLLADTPERLALLRSFLEASYEELLLIGGYALEDVGNDWDAVVNEINAAAPDLVLSAIATPVQEEFLMRNFRRLGIRLWYGLSDRDFLPKRQKRMLPRIGKGVIGFFWKRRVKSYEQPSSK